MAPWVVFLLSLAFAAVPTGLYAFVIWWLDWYERESPRMILFSFFWGAVVAAGFGAIAEVLLDIPLQAIFAPPAADFLLLTFAAPVIEECLKGALLLIILQETEFDNLTDGLVYGAIVGLGFSLSENVAYFYGAYAEGGELAWLGNVLFRGAFCTTLHATATAITGAAIGIAKFSRRRSRWVIIGIGFLLAGAVHMGWNGFLSLGEILSSGLLSAMSMFALPIVAIAVALLFHWSLGREQSIIRRELAAEAALGWLPPAHVEILAKIARRHESDWLPAGVDQWRYVRTLTELAFRRCQLRFVPARQRVAYARLIERLRQEGQTLLTAGGASAQPIPPAPWPATPLRDDALLPPPPTVPPTD